MKKHEIFTIAAPLTAALLLGTSACGADYDRGPSSIAPPTTCDMTRDLGNVRLIGAAKEGGVNAVNGGECTTVRYPGTLRAIGELAQNATFVIECLDDDEPPTFMIRAQGLSGIAHLDKLMTERVQQGEFGDIPQCPSPA